MRKAQAKKLPLAPDPRFNDKLVTRFVNNLMWQGKKSGAFNIFYDAVDKVSKQTGEDGYEIWKKAVAQRFKFLLKFGPTEKYRSASNG